MPAKRRPKSRKPKKLTYKDIDYHVKYKPAGVQSSKDLIPCAEIIGQERAVESIKLGLNVKSRGYNIFVTGLAGTGRTTTIKHLLEQLDHKRPELLDICYVNNFKNDQCPRVLTFFAGDGKRFKQDMGRIINSIRKVIPKIFLTEDYKDKQNRIVREFESRQKKLISEFEDQMSESGFVMVQIQAGVGVRNEIQPLVDEEPASFDKLEQLVKDGKYSAAQLDEMRRKWDSLQREFESTSIESKKLAGKAEDALEKFRYSVVAPLVMDKVNVIRRLYPDPKVIAYLDEVEEALVGDIDRFREAQPRRGEEEPVPTRKREPFEEFSVNLLLDNAETESVPVVVETSPSYNNLFGSLERVVDRFGYWRTDFTRIFSGSLLKASGGYLVVNAADLITEQGVWQPLKRALRNGEMEITGYDPFYMMAGAGIKPEPIKVDVKVVLIGDPSIYQALYRLDEDFKKIFKIKAEFDSVMELNNCNVDEYYKFVQRMVDENKLPPFELSGMQAVTEYGRRLSGHRDKLSIRFTDVADIVREAAFWANQRRARRVARKDVQAAVSNRRRRVNLSEDKMQELYDNNTLMVSTEGSVVGQINGLSVLSTGEYAFGRPSRITVNTSLGRAGVINIEREADLSGPTHNKGIAILSGYLRQTFAQDKPLMMSASISFEQSYGGIDGDSASSTEIYGILSSLAELPIDQNFAVTGSVNQKGQIQPIGGVNEKIEGFYDVCNNRGLTGDQGVLIPVQNVRDLMLRPDVMEAIKKNKFRVYPVSTIEEGIELLTGVPGGRRESDGRFTPGSVMEKVDQKLYNMAVKLQQFSKSVEKDAEENDGNDQDPKSETRKRD